MKLAMASCNGLVLTDIAVFIDDSYAKHWTLDNFDDTVPSSRVLTVGKKEAEICGRLIQMSITSAVAQTSL